MHLSYRDAPWELSTKDADFSWAAIEERWALGYRDATRACAAAPWLEQLVVRLDADPKK